MVLCLLQNTGVLGLSLSSGMNSVFINGLKNTRWMYFVLIQMRTSVPCEIVLNCLHVTQFSVIKKKTFIFIKDAYRAVINVFFLYN